MATEGRFPVVGNRSMHIHMVPCWEISLECFERNPYDHRT
jgi:hypothetical protein